jgi:hypothetical protein
MRVAAPRAAGATAAAFAALLAAAAPGVAQVPGAPPVPIPGDVLSAAPAFEGGAAAPRPVRGVREPPRHPFMAPNGRSNIHNDAFQTDAYRVSGPLGEGPETSTLFTRECASIAFDAAGHLVTVCVGLDRPVLALMDPHTLQVLAAEPLPPRNAESGSDPFTDFSGGGYFYLDHQGHAIVSTNDGRVLDYAIAAGPAFALAREYPLGGAIAASDGIISVLPDWDGLLWFVTRAGVVGTIERGSGKVRTLRLRSEGISNSFAVDDTGGVFVVSDKALYRFDAARSHAPRTTWRRVYPNSGIRKPGQSDAGSGTTPTLLGRKWVAITDNADPMNVRVLRRGKRVRPPRAAQRRRLRVLSKQARRIQKKLWKARRREVCAEGVFQPGASATDQSLIGAGRSLVVENNYGYSGITATQLGGTTEPGLARVDVQRVKSKTSKDARGRPPHWRCHEVWTSAERAPSVVPKLSLANGLVYIYAKPPSPALEDPWYLTALDFRTGRTVYRRLAGGGLVYNNNYAPVTLGPDGTAYVGVLGGLVAFGP